MSMEKNLFTITEKVHDEETFLEFLRVLMKDREREVALEKKNPSSPYGAGALGWENITIEDYLESAIAWAEDSEEPNESYTKPENPWKRVAQIFHAGKTYE